jgi:hypothetical protein
MKIIYIHVDRGLFRIFSYFVKKLKLYNKHKQLSNILLLVEYGCISKGGISSSP